MLKYIKEKIKVWVMIITTLFSMTTMPLYAQAAGGGGGGGDMLYYLMLIEQHTNNILANVNNLPTYLQSLTALALGVLAEDDSDSTAELQANFSQLTNDYATTLTTQGSTEQQIVKDYFAAFTPDNLPYANDLTYTTLLGKPFYTSDPRDTATVKTDSSLNYLKNVAGLNIIHQIPNRSWKGSPSDQQKYAATFQALTAVQTFNAYVLSQLYADAKSGYQVTKTQSALISQASDPAWFTAIASENIGVVLRQILMYNSQVYVLLTQLLQTQKQALAAQAMANTLLIVGNQFTEERLAGNAAIRK